MDSTLLNSCENPIQESREDQKVDIANRSSFLQNLSNSSVSGEEDSEKGDEEEKKSEEADSRDDED